MWDEWVIKGIRHHDSRVDDALEVVKECMWKVETCLERKAGTTFSHDVIMNNVRKLDDAMRRFVAACDQMDYFHQDTFVVKGVDAEEDED